MYNIHLRQQENKTFFPLWWDEKNKLRHIVIAKRVQSETQKNDSGNFKQRQKTHTETKNRDKKHTQKTQLQRHYTYLTHSRDKKNEKNFLMRHY